MPAEVSSTPISHTSSTFYFRTIWLVVGGAAIKVIVLVVEPLLKLRFFYVFLKLRSLHIMDYRIQYLSRTSSQTLQSLVLASM